MLFCKKWRENFHSNYISITYNDSVYSLKDFIVYFSMYFVVFLS